MSDENPAKSRKPAGKPRSTTFKKGQSGNPAGRKKGVPNKATLECKMFWEALTNDPEYLQLLWDRAKHGLLAPAMETMGWGYARGKPKEHIQVTMVSKEQFDAMDPDELAEWKAASALADALIAKRRGRQF